MPLAKILYRDLLHAAKQFDRRASLRALLSTNLLQRPVVHETNTRLPHVERFNRAVLEFLDNRSFYVPSTERKTLVQLVTEQFRDAAADERIKVDTAFVALKALNDKLAEAKALGVIDPKPARKLRYGTAPRSAAAATDAASVSVPDVQHAEALASGVFLLSHPLLSGLFSRSVIVLTEHSLSGARGFIVNQPTPDPLMKAFKVHPSIMRAFGSSKVRTGGPVRTEHAEVLHANPAFGGERIRTSNFHTVDTETDTTSLFVGVDLETAAQAVETEAAQQSELMFLNGVSTWTAGQLENELKRGTWVAVKAPLSLAVNPRKELWADLMQSLGGEYRELSAMPVIADDDADDDDDSEQDDDE